MSAYLVHIGSGLRCQIVLFRDPYLRNRKFLQNNNHYFSISFEKKVPKKNTWPNFEESLSKVFKTKA